MSTNPPIQKIPRVVKCNGAIKPLRLISVSSRCGDIKNGIALAFEGEGCFVIDTADLESIVQEAKAAKPTP